MCVCVYNGIFHPHHLKKRIHDCATFCNSILSFIKTSHKTLSYIHQI